MTQLFLTTSSLAILMALLTSTHTLPLSAPSVPISIAQPLDLLIDPIFQTEQDDLESKKVVAKSVYNTVIRVTSQPCEPGMQRVKEGGPCVTRYSSSGPALDEDFQLSILKGIPSLGTRRPTTGRNRNRHRTTTAIPTTTEPPMTTTTIPVVEEDTKVESEDPNPVHPEPIAVPNAAITTSQISVPMPQAHPHQDTRPEEELPVQVPSTETLQQNQNDDNGNKAVLEISPVKMKDEGNDLEQLLLSTTLEPEGSVTEIIPGIKVDRESMQTENTDMTPAPALLPSTIPSINEDIVKMTLDLPADLEPMGSSDLEETEQKEPKGVLLDENENVMVNQDQGGTETEGDAVIKPRDNGIDTELIKQEPSLQDSNLGAEDDEREDKESIPNPNPGQGVGSDLQSVSVLESDKNDTPQPHEERNDSDSDFDTKEVEEINHNEPSNPIREESDVDAPAPNVTMKVPEIDPDQSKGESGTLMSDTDTDDASVSDNHEEPEHDDMKNNKGVENLPIRTIEDNSVSTEVPSSSVKKDNVVKLPESQSQVGESPGESEPENDEDMESTESENDNKPIKEESIESETDMNPVKEESTESENDTRPVKNENDTEPATDNITSQNQIQDPEATNDDKAREPLTLESPQSQIVNQPEMNMTRSQDSKDINISLEPKLSQIQTSTPSIFAQTIINFLQNRQQPSSSSITFPDESKQLSTSSIRFPDSTEVEEIDKLHLRSRSKNRARSSDEVIPFMPMPFPHLFHHGGGGESTTPGLPATSMSMRHDNFFFPSPAATFPRLFLGPSISNSNPLDHRTLGDNYRRFRVF